MKRPPDDYEDEQKPGVPGFKTWRGLYLFVFAVFVVTVAALVVFSQVFA